MKKLLLTTLMLVSAICAGTVYAQTPTNQSATANPEVSTATEYKWYTMESTNDGDNARKHLFLLYESSNETPLHTVLLSDGVADGVNLTTGGESIPEKYLWRLDDAGSGNVFLVNKASGLRISVPSSANNTNSTKLEMSVAGAVWSKEIPSGNAANQVTFDYTGYKDEENNTHQPAYLNAMLASAGYGVTIYQAGQNQSSGWYFYPAYTETVEATTYCAPDMKVNSNKNHQTRHVTAITVTGGTADFSGNGYSSATDRPVYEAHLDQVIVCRPGDVLTPVIAHDPEDWVHKYVYVDWDDNKVFDVVTGTPGQKNWGELVSYTYIETSSGSSNGYNSEGTSVNSEAQNAKLGSFTVPDTIASGDYRIRFKVDWNSTDPCGNMSQDNYIADNGGTVIDLTLRVDNRAKAPEFSPASGTGLTLGAQQQITITSDAGATIYYTTDGSDPVPGTSSSIQSGETVPVTADSYSDVITVKAVAQTDGKDLSDVASATYTVIYPYCVLEGQTQNRSDNRYVTDIRVSYASGTEFFRGSGYSQEQNRPIYEKHLDQVIVCRQGDLLKPVIGYEGHHMHKYVYVDWDKDGVFEVANGTAGQKNWGELVSYSYIDGKGSDGSDSNKDNIDEPLGSFEIPTDMEAGDYIIRFKIAWDDTDPCGNDAIATDGGAVIDLTLRVGNRTAAPVFDPASGTVFPIGEYATVTVKSADVDAVIYYTTDGSEPSTSSAQIANGGEIYLRTDNWTNNYTVKAVAKVDGKDLSSVSTATYTVDNPYDDICKPKVDENNRNKRVMTKAEIQNGSGILSVHTVFSPSVLQKQDQAYSNITDVVVVEPGAKFNFSVTYSTQVGWGNLVVYQMKSSDDYSVIYGPYDGAWKQGISPNNLFASVYSKNDGASVDQTNGIITFPITIPADSKTGDIVVLRFLIPGADTVDTPCPQDLDECNYCDFIFCVYSIPEDKNVTVDTEEDDDVVYATVTVGKEENAQEEPVWEVGAHQTAADSLVINVEADGATPEISIDGNGSISAQTIKVVRKITSDQWTLMSMPFTFNLSEVQVNGVAANYNDNIRIKEYDAALRANNSVDGYTASGWVEKTSGTIAANEGFAIVVNPANGAEQTVTFTTTGFTMDANDKQITFTEQPSNANVINGKSMDSDWNLKGNPMLQSAEKGQGCTLYVHEAGTNTYRELSSTDQHTYSPFVAWFVQCDNDGGFMNLTFSHNGTSTYGSSMEDNITGRFDILINGGEDEARVTVLEGSSESYVRNEDAMYFAPLNNKISQLYLIDKEGAQIASSVVPAPYDEVKLAYKAAVAGAQTLTVTSVIPGTAVYLVDNEEGTETLMNEGSEYSFTSEAGLNSERFAVKTIIEAKQSMFTR